MKKLRKKSLIKEEKGLVMKIEGDVLTVNGMRELLQDLKCVCGLDWKKEAGTILAAEIEATLNKPYNIVRDGKLIETVYYNKISE